MAKFKFLYWLVVFLASQESFRFDWDDGNMTKNEDKHGVDVNTIESCFDDQNLLALGKQYQPIVKDARYGIIAKAKSEDICFVCFTVRQDRIRVISARFANRKERGVYEQKG